MRRKRPSDGALRHKAKQRGLLSLIVGHHGAKYTKAVLSHVAEGFDTVRIWSASPDRLTAQPDTILLAHSTPQGELLSYRGISEKELSKFLADEALTEIPAERLSTKIRRFSVDADGLNDLSASAGKVSLSLAGIILPERRTSEGLLIESTSLVWARIVEELKADWSKAYQIPPDKWEEIIAGAYFKAGFDEVILTPRSGDHGRDVIAIRKGVGSVKIIGSVKANRPRNLVRYDDIRALIGVLAGERNASKGVITTTSDFPPRVMSDPIIAPFVPYRLELMNSVRLKEWLSELLMKK
jgi:restriction system protein